MVRFRMPLFIRRFLRKVMNPIDYETAMKKRNKIALIYAIIAWNAAGIAIYQIYRGNYNWNSDSEEDKLRTSVKLAHKLGIANASAIRISGFSVSDRVDFQVDPERPILEAVKSNPNKNLFKESFGLSDEEIQDIRVRKELLEPIPRPIM